LFDLLFSFDRVLVEFDDFDNGDDTGFRTELRMLKLKARDRDGDI
jgi:hypothetical protein